MLAIAAGGSAWGRGVTRRDGAATDQMRQNFGSIPSRHMTSPVTRISYKSGRMGDARDKPPPPPSRQPKRGELLF
jgi:hypothetical protein